MMPGTTVTLAGQKEFGNDAYTKLLLHFDDTRFMDASIGGTPRVATPCGASINTSIKKFGTSSLYFPGGNASYMFVKNTPDFDFGSGDFTVDWWEYRLSSTLSSASFRRQADNAVQGFLLNHATNDGRYQTYMSSNGSSWDIAGGPICGSIDLNVWVHYAVVRNGSTFYHFKNGVQTATWSSSAALLAAPANQLLTLGHWSGVGFHGYMDEIRISKGIARWTTNFTPPSRAYGPAPPDRSAYHTVGLYHFDNPTNAVGTVFVDSSPYAKPNTGGNSYGYGPTAKFGSASTYFNTANLYVSIPADDDWNFGGGDFTIDWWDWPSDAENRPIIVRSGAGITYQPFLFYRQAAGYIRFYSSSDQASWNIVNDLSLGTYSLSVWAHRAVVRKDGVFYGFKDGVLQQTINTAINGVLPTYIDHAPLLGAWNLTGGGQVWSHGLVDELRISKGIARWTANFTPPTAPY